MEQNRICKNKQTQLQPSNFCLRLQKHTLEKKYHLQQMVLEKLLIYLQKTKINTKWVKDLNIMDGNTTGKQWKLESKIIF
jgi:hypothetical protein